jgi:hypothetical protein
VLSKPVGTRATSPISPRASGVGTAGDGVTGVLAGVGAAAEPFHPPGACAAYDGGHAAIGGGKAFGKNGLPPGTCGCGCGCALYPCKRDPGAIVPGTGIGGCSSDCGGAPDRADGLVPAAPMSAGAPPCCGGGAWYASGMCCIPAKYGSAAGGRCDAGA